MNDRKNTQQEIGWLLDSQKLAVLSTRTPEGHPYVSLVAFASAADLKCILFVTPATTRKYANLRADPRVALLIDSRSNQDADIHHAMAVTALGSAQIVEKDQARGFLDRYLAKHPHLEEFAKAPTSAWIRVHIHRYVHVKNFQTVMELRMQ